MNQVNNKEIASIKEDTKELKKLISIINGEVHEVKNILLGKVSHSDEHHQLSKGEIQKICRQPSSIQGLQHDIHVDNIHTNAIRFLLELKDKRIASCGQDQLISIVSLDFQTKKWKQDIKKENAHNASVNCLLELEKDRLVSCSSDCTIKIWSITPNALNLLSTLTNHTGHVWKIITFTHNRFSSGSNDKTVKIWSNEHPYNVIVSLLHDNYVHDLLKLKQKEILISNTYKTSIDFWDSNIYKKLYSIKGHSANCFGKKMIELHNGLVAISSSTSNNVLIVDPITYSIVKEIKEEGYITHYSSLCELDPHSFIYVYEGKVVQIATDNEYRILFKTNAEQQLNGENGIINVKEGEHLIIINSSKTGFGVIKPYY